MWLPFALTAALLTSFLPIISKRLLADTPVSVVAWSLNAFSLPILGAATLWAIPIGTVDTVFWAALAASGLLNFAATFISTQALKWGDASLVTPLLTFNPAFTLALAAVTLGEIPSTVGALGVALIGLGAIVLAAGEGGRSWKQTLRLFAAPALLAALGASLLWAVTPIVEKIAIQHSDPQNPPLVAFGSTALMALFMAPPAMRQPARNLGALRAHWRGIGLGTLIAGVAPVFGFTAIGAGPVGYVTAIFKLSAVFTVLWSALLLGESNVRSRLSGAALMVLGAVLIGL
jgi:uncharacterized membrane protein